MNYEKIFGERGSCYDSAMRLFPDARREEFRIPVQQAALAPGSIVVDVPAGGGYLQRYLPESCRWFGHEPCADFSRGSVALDQRLLPLPWQDEFADAAISIAGLHHLEDKQALFREVYRALRPGGRVVLADAHEESRVARFLDEFVGRYNSTGHEGIYLNDSTLADLQSCGFTVQHAERTPYCWWFADRRQLGGFCRLLFDIRHMDAAGVADGVEEYLGLSSGDGQLGINWELLVVTGEKSRGQGWSTAGSRGRT